LPDDVKCTPHANPTAATSSVDATLPSSNGPSDIESCCLSAAAGVRAVSPPSFTRDGGDGKTPKMVYQTSGKHAKNPAVGTGKRASAPHVSSAKERDEDELLRQLEAGEVAIPRQHSARVQRAVYRMSRSLAGDFFRAMQEIQAERMETRDTPATAAHTPVLRTPSSPNTTSAPLAI
jgi:hypothetical protein